MAFATERFGAMKHKREASEGMPDGAEVEEDAGKRVRHDDNK